MNPVGLVKLICLGALVHIVLLPKVSGTLVTKAVRSASPLKGAGKRQLKFLPASTLLRAPESGFGEKKPETNV